MQKINDVRDHPGITSQALLYPFPCRHVKMLAKSGRKQKSSQLILKYGDGNWNRADKKRCCKQRATVV